VTISDALSDLPSLGIGEGAEEMDYQSYAQSDYQTLLRKNSDHVYNHFSARLAPINTERMKQIPQGGSWRDLPTSLLPAGMTRARRSDHTKRYGRMHPDRQACTILTKCDPHWGAYIQIRLVPSRSERRRDSSHFQTFSGSSGFAESNTSKWEMPFPRFWRKQSQKLYYP